MDKLLPHLHSGLRLDQAEGIKTHWQKTILLVMAITLHNIPEGLAVGVAFGAVAANLPSATLAGAIALALGIGLQNFPEGMAVSIPLRREGLSAWRSFFYGQLSAVVEPIAAVIGAAAVLNMRAILPYALAFAAGAMIYVVVEEVIPEAQRRGKLRCRHPGCDGRFCRDDVPGRRPWSLKRGRREKHLRPTVDLRHVRSRRIQDPAHRSVRQR